VGVHRSPQRPKAKAENDCVGDEKRRGTWALWLYFWGGCGVNRKRERGFFRGGGKRIV